MAGFAVYMSFLTSVLSHSLWRISTRKKQAVPDKLRRRTLLDALPEEGWVLIMSGASKCCPRNFLG
jgi:hypothetical protein